MDKVIADPVERFDRGTLKLGLKTEDHPDAGFCVRDPDGIPVQIVRS